MNVQVGERAKGYAQAFLKTGLVGSRKVSLIFTGERILIATIGKELEKEETKKAKEFARSAGKGMLGRFAASTLLLGQSFERRYSAMVPTEILAESTGNFDIPFACVDRALLKVDKVSDFQGLESGEEYRMEIYTREGKHKFRIQGYFGTVKALMEENLGEKFSLSR